MMQAEAAQPKPPPSQPPEEQTPDLPPTPTPSASTKESAAESGPGDYDDVMKVGAHVLTGAKTAARARAREGEARDASERAAASHGPLLSVGYGMSNVGCRMRARCRLAWSAH